MSNFFRATPKQPESSISTPTTISRGFYNNTNCGISTLFPINWTVTEHAEDEELNKIENVLLTASPPSKSLITFELSVLDISNPSVYPKKSLDEVVEFEIDYITTGPYDTIETIKNTKISGYPARTVVYNEDYQTLHNRIMKSWVVASDKAYQVTYDSPREEYTQYLARS